jgi:amino-acid N-acetyltransferase
MPVGFGGVEIHGRDALIRSIITLPPVRSRGVGKAIVAALEAEAAIAGCRAAWLLTNSAKQFFETLGYTARERQEVPEGIRSSTEYVSLCPTDATVMVKHLA